MSTDKEIRDALTKFKKIAVVGISPKADRASFGVSNYMKRAGYEITGVRPGGSGTKIHDRPVFDKLADVPGPLEIIDVFRNSDAIPEVVDEVLSELMNRPKGEGPKVIWLQEGVSHPEAEKKARDAGLVVISDLCILKEHARLL